MTSIRRVSALGVVWFLQRQIRCARRLAIKQPVLGFFGFLGLIGACALRTLSAAAPPDTEADEEKQEHQAADEDIWPATQDHLLIQFLLFCCRHWRVLHLTWGEEGPFWVAEGVVAPKSGLHKIVLCLDGVGHRGELNVRVTGTSAMGPVPEVE